MDTQESQEIKPEDILRILRHKQTDETYIREIRLVGRIAFSQISP